MFRWSSVWNVLEILQNSQETLVPDSLFKVSCRASAYHFTRKETSTQMFSCEFYKIFKKNYLTKHILATVSVFCIFSANLVNPFVPNTPLGTNGLKKLFKWFFSISETAAADSISKSFGCHNCYQYFSSKNVKPSPMPSPAWNSFKTFWKICPHSKRPPRYFHHIRKIRWKRLVYPNYFFSCGCDLDNYIGIFYRLIFKINY